jgi:hypothetical protein
VIEVILRSLVIHPIAGLAGVACCFGVLAAVGESSDAAVGVAYVLPAIAAGFATAGLARGRGRGVAVAAAWGALTTTVVAATVLLLLLALLVIAAVKGAGS